MMVTQGK